jgi:hypothetical protein
LAYPASWSSPTRAPDPIHAHARAWAGPPRPLRPQPLCRRHTEAAPYASPTDGPRRSLSLTGGARLHPLPPDSSKHSVSIEEGKGEGAESCDWCGRDSPCPRDHLARQATKPAPHASRTHATPPMPSARA